MPQSDLSRRHDWVTLPEDWRRGLLSPLAPEDEEALARWAEKRRPLVVARRQDGDAPGMLRLGLALPGKKRVGVAMLAEVVELLRRPPFFRDIVETGAAFWPEPIRELALLVARVAPDTRVFGSLAWQFFAADPAYAYVTPASDIDLLLAPTDGARLASCIALLHNFESRWPTPRLDGEIILPNGDFVSWREFSTRPKRILVKGAAHVGLRPIGDIDALLAARAA
jgi:phosphoribosyl-dephospho-CoA transferase